MKCPHCGYVYKGQWDFDKNEMVNEGCGNFYVLTNHQLERGNGRANYENVASLVGCPDCRKVFID
jgi:uncharacterized C2H2 Zn-finger protein